MRFRFPHHVAAALGALLLAVPARPTGPAPAGDDPHAACRAAAGAAQATKPEPSHAGHEGRAAAAGEPEVDHAAHAARAAAAAKAEARAPADASVTLEEIALVDQHGEARRFRSEVVGDRILVMDFIFTTCTTICPLLSSRMARLQERLGERLGRDVYLVSVSVDPGRDTPRKLLAYAKRWKARPGWTFLTGPKPEVDAVLKGLGAYTASFADHPPMFLVGDGKAEKWVRLNGFPDADQLLEQVDRMDAERGEKTAALGRRR